MFQSICDLVNGILIAVGLQTHPEDMEGQYANLHNELKGRVIGGMYNIIRLKKTKWPETHKLYKPYEFYVDLFMSSHPLSAIVPSIDFKYEQFFNWFVEVGQDRLYRDLNDIGIYCVVLTFRGIPLETQKWRQLMEDIRVFYDSPPNVSSSIPLFRKGGDGFHETAKIL